MAVNRTFLVFLVLTSLLASCLSLPASKDKDTAGDVHLNGVLPESDSPSQPLKVQEQQAAAAVNSLELQPEAEATTMRGPPTDKLPGDHGNPPYFSRVIQSIFEIPIAVLTAVRNLLQTTAVPKYPSP